MNTSLIGHLCIVSTIFFTVYGQLILKWRINHINITTDSKLIMLFNYFCDPLILTGFLSAFVASLTWMLAMSKFELSYAYPFMALNFVIVILLSNLFFSEPISMLRVLGVMLIVLGTIVAAQG